MSKRSRVEDHPELTPEPADIRLCPFTWLLVREQQLFLVMILLRFRRGLDNLYHARWNLDRSLQEALVSECTMKLALFKYNPARRSKYEVRP